LRGRDRIAGNRGNTRSYDESAYKAGRGHCVLPKDKTGNVSENAPAGLEILQGHSDWWNNMTQIRTLQYYLGGFAVTIYF
jgi:hypothetical protein